jgi:hypothetical protein
MLAPQFVACATTFLAGLLAQNAPVDALRDSDITRLNHIAMVVDGIGYTQLREFIPTEADKVRFDAYYSDYIAAITRAHNDADTQSRMTISHDEFRRLPHEEQLRVNRERSRLMHTLDAQANVNSDQLLDSLLENFSDLRSVDERGDDEIATVLREVLMNSRHRKFFAEYEIGTYGDFAKPPSILQMYDDFLNQHPSIAQALSDSEADRRLQRARHGYLLALDAYLQDRNVARRTLPHHIRAPEWGVFADRQDSRNREIGTIIGTRWARVFDPTRHFSDTVYAELVQLDQLEAASRWQLEFYAGYAPALFTNDRFLDLVADEFQSSTDLEFEAAESARLLYGEFCQRRQASRIRIFHLAAADMRVYGGTYRVAESNGPRIATIFDTVKADHDKTLAGIMELMPEGIRASWKQRIKRRQMEKFPEMQIAPDGGN